MTDANAPYPHLFDRFALAGLELKNRIAVAPMTRTSASREGIPNEAMLNYYTRYAEGDFGLIISEGTYTDKAYSQGYEGQPGITDEAQIGGWRKITEAAHRAGARMFCQLMHAGALSQGNIHREETVAPSAVRPVGEQLTFYGGSGPYPLPREMTLGEIAEAIAGFAAAAVNARDAGFDGVEIHGANGYLLDQFLTTYTNQRTDEYGGGVGRRIVFAARVIQAVRKAVGPDFPVGIRLSQSKVNDYDYKWPGGEHDAQIIFGATAEASADFIHVTEYQVFRPAFSDEGPTLAALAKNCGRLPVIANGGVNDPGLAEELIARGEMDVIAIGKAALANKDWPQKVASGRPLEEFRPEAFFVPDARIKEFEQ